MESRHENREERGERAEAKEWLLEFLGSGTQRRSDVQREAQKAGISERTLKRAKADLGIKARRIGGADGYWAWERPFRKEDQYIERGPLNPESQKNRVNNNNLVKGGQEGQEGQYKNRGPLHRKEVDLRAD